MHKTSLCVQRMPKEREYLKHILLSTLTSFTKVVPQEVNVIRKHQQSKDNYNNSENLHYFMRFLFLVALKGIV